MWLTPVSGSDGTTWTFIDNIFDQVAFHGPDPDNGKGPVGNNRNNAYVAMGESRLVPNTQSATDKVLGPLSYPAGPPGRFYLPAGTSLLGGGSRSAAHAGLWHFTSLPGLPSAKQADAVHVNIGPAYLALDASGAPADADADGVPDFMEDRNGNGINDIGETDWQAADILPIAILGTLDGTTVSGTIQVPVQFDPTSADVVGISLITATGDVLGTLAFPSSPALLMDLNTARVANGSLTLFARATRAPYSSGTPYVSLDSAPITITVQNDLSYALWNAWTGDDDAVFNLTDAQAPLSYELHIFDSDFAKSYAPEALKITAGTATDPNFSVAWALSTSGAQGGDQHPTFYTALAVAGASSAAALPPTGQGLAFPDVGAWYVAFEDSFNKIYTGNQSSPVQDPLQPFSPLTWFRDGALESWKYVGAWFVPPAAPAPNGSDPPPVGNPLGRRTWPIRYCNYDRERMRLASNVRADWSLFLARLGDPNPAFQIRNLYIGSHMSMAGLGPLPRKVLGGFILGRYHFVYLDGCESRYLLDLFHFDAQERDLLGVDISHYTSPPLGATSKRPGAAVAALDSFSVTVLTPGDPQYVGYIPAEVAQYYMDFQQRWTVGQQTLYEAHRRAGLTAASKGVPIPNPPWNSLAVFGYRSLLHNEYNLRSSW